MASIYDIVGNNTMTPVSWGNQFSGAGNWGNQFNSGVPNAFQAPAEPGQNQVAFNNIAPNNNPYDPYMQNGSGFNPVYFPGDEGRGTRGGNQGNATGDAGIGAAQNQTQGTSGGFGMNALGAAQAAAMQANLKAAQEAAAAAQAGNPGGTGGNTGGTGGTPATPPQNQFNPQQQAWMNANQGWQADIMKAMLGGQQFGFDPMNIQWQNFNNGNTENITRAMGVLNNPTELAKLMGGEAVQSPFATFGTQQRDQYIKMPNGQMIDASAMAKQLSGAMGSANPFSSLSDVLNLYGHWNNQHTNDPNVNTDAINLVQQGVISPQAPPNWDPSQFAGGNPTYTPSGPVPGNPGNPGMGTSNPIQFQGGQMNYQNGPNGFPIFNNTNGNISGGTTPTPNTGAPAAPTPGTPAPGNPNAGAPQGVNQNNQYYLAGANNPRAKQGGLYGQAGLAQTSSGGGGGFGAGLYNQPGGVRSNQQMNQPFNQPKPTGQVAGNLPNGTSVLGK